MASRRVDARANQGVPHRSPGGIAYRPARYPGGVRVSQPGCPTPVSGSHSLQRDLSTRRISNTCLSLFPMNCSRNLTRAMPSPIISCCMFCGTARRTARHSGQVAVRSISKTPLCRHTRRSSLCFAHAALPPMPFTGCICCISWKVQTLGSASIWAVVAAAGCGSPSAFPAS